MQLNQDAIATLPPTVVALAVLLVSSPGAPLAAQDYNQTWATFDLLSAE